MTGALCIIGDGSMLQPLVGTLFQLMFLLAVLKLSPYDSDDDDLSSFVASLALCLATLCAMVLSYAGDSTGDAQSAFDAETVGTSLIAITVANAAFEVVMVVRATRCCQRSDEEGPRGDRGGGGLTKVSPTTAEDEDASSSNETERQARRSGVQAWE